MSRLWAKIRGMFSNRTFVGIDKAGNRYFARHEEIDGIIKEKRSVIFKAEDEPTTIPVEWICWLNGQRKTPPTPEEMMELEARRERVRLNVARLKKEEEEKNAKKSTRFTAAEGKVAGPDLKSFIQQFPDASEGEKFGESSVITDGMRSTGRSEADKDLPRQHKPQPESSEPTGSGESFRPGTWQPPT